MAKIPASASAGCVKSIKNVPFNECKLFTRSPIIFIAQLVVDLIKFLETIPTMPDVDWDLFGRSRGIEKRLRDLTLLLVL